MKIIYGSLLGIFFCFLIFAMVIGLVNPSPRYLFFNKINRLFADFSFWTTQTNWMFFLFFLFLFLDGKWELWKPKLNHWMFFLSYITVTMILFWSALGAMLGNPDIDNNPLVFYSNEYTSLSKWFITINTHLTTFLVSIITFIVFVKKEYIDISNWYKKDLLYGWIFPFFYISWVFIRMLIMQLLGFDYFLNHAPENAKIPDWVIEIGSKNISYFSAPYFFFNYGIIPNGHELFLWGSIGCLLFITFIQYLWIFINNLIVKEKTYNKKIYKTNKLNEFIKIILYLGFSGFVIYKLTKTENYAFKNIETYFYDFVYICLYVVCLVLIIIGIINSICLILNKFKNHTFTFIIPVLLAGFLILSFGLSLVFFISSYYTLKQKEVL